MTEKRSLRLRAEAPVTQAALIVLGAPAYYAGRAVYLPAVVAFLFIFDIHRGVEVDVENVGDGDAGENQDEAKHVTSFYNVKNVSVR